MYVYPAFLVSFGEDTKSSPMIVQIMFYVIVPLVCSLSVVYLTVLQLYEIRFTNSLLG